MSLLAVKTAPVLQDRTIQDEDALVENMEVVLCEQEDAVVEEADSNVKADPDLLNLIEGNDWVGLSEKLHNLEEGAEFCSQNNVLHLVCSNGAPLDLVKTVLAMNTECVKKPDAGGFLPLHFACSSNCAPSVIQLLVETYPQSASIATKEGSLLPLHIACRQALGSDVLVTLMTFSPDGLVAKDIFGRPPLDYARSIESDVIRGQVIKSLELGAILRTSFHFGRNEVSGDMNQRIKTLSRIHKKKFKVVTAETNQEILKLRKKSEMQLVDAKRQHQSAMKKFVSNTQETVGKSIFAMQQKIIDTNKQKEEELSLTSKRYEEKVELLTQQMIRAKDDAKNALQDAYKKHQDEKEALIASNKSKLEETIRIHQEEAKGALESHNESIKTHETIQSGLKDEIKELKKDQVAALEVLAASCNHHEKKFASMTTSGQSLVQRLLSFRRSSEEALKKKDEEHELIITDLQAKFDAEMTKILTDHQEFSTMSTKLHEEEVQALQKIQNDLRKELDVKKTECKDQDQQIIELVETIEAETTEHAVALEGEWKRIDNLQLEVAEKQCRVVSLERELVGATTKAEGLQKKLNAKEFDFGLALDEIGELKKKLSRLQSSMQSIRELADTTGQECTEETKPVRPRSMSPRKDTRNMSQIRARSVSPMKSSSQLEKMDLKQSSQESFLDLEDLEASEAEQREPGIDLSRAE